MPADNVPSSTSSASEASATIHARRPHARPVGILSVTVVILDFLAGVARRETRLSTANEASRKPHSEDRPMGVPTLGGVGCLPAFAGELSETDPPAQDAAARSHQGRRPH